MNEAITSRVTDVLVKMGDPDAEEFSREEVERYYLKAQDQFCRDVRPALFMTIHEDLAECANYNFDFEFDHMDVRTGKASYNFDFEIPYLRRPGRGPVSINFQFERAYAPSAQVAAVIDVPAESLQVERVTWDERRVEPLTSQSASLGVDFQYESNRGPVEAYITDKDGLNSLRRYKIPYGLGSHFDYQGRWGLPSGSPTVVALKDRRSAMRLGPFARMSDAHTIYPPDVFIGISFSFGFNTLQEAVQAGFVTIPIFAGMTVVGRGVLRRLPGFHPADRSWGLMRWIRFDHLNTRIEFQARTHDPRAEAAFEIPDHYLVYLDFYVMAEMYAREGPYQDLVMADHYRNVRYQEGVILAKQRMSRTNSMRLIVAGGSITDRPMRPPLSRPPINFPEGAFTRRRRRGGRYHGF